MAAPIYTGEFPFESPSPNPGPECGVECGPGQSGVVCGSADSCSPCELEDINFLNCYVIGFSGKLGLGGSESNVVIDLVERALYPCPSTSPCASGEYPGSDCDTQNSTYSGELGHVYTFQVGGFCFTGILANHSYSENDAGYRYKVSLTDGRQALGNVTVILNGYYSDVPQTAKPNLINALYEIEKSVGDDICGSGNKCKDFVKSGANQKGIFIKKALEAINQKVVQLPISNSCLIMDLTKLINIASPYQRVTSTESNVLELISMACEEVGHDFFIRIVGNTIEVVPVNKTEQIPPRALFDFMEDLSKNNPVSDREYGEELTFEKSKRLILGTNYHYLITVDTQNNVSDICGPTDPPSSTGVCPGDDAYRRFNYRIDDEPGSQYQEPAQSPVTNDPLCDTILQQYTP